MFLWSVLTTIPTPTQRPVKLCDLGFRVGTKVTIPYLDSRSCDGITINMHEDKIVKTLFDYATTPPASDMTLRVALKVYYRDKIVFHGPLHAPEFDYAAGTISLAAHDPSLRLKHSYLFAADNAVANGITLDGEGILSLLDSAQNLTAWDTAGWPSLGIFRGRDTTTSNDTRRKHTVGDEIWQSMTDMANLSIGPDLFVVPVESDPAELASGSASSSPGSAIPDNTVTDYSLAVGLPGKIGGLALSVWADHANPRQVNLDLVHPDGTVIRVYTGIKDKVASGTNFLGTNNTPTTTAIFNTGGTSPYPAAQPYPHVGHFRSDRSLNGLLDKPATGTWKLRVTDTAAGSIGTLHYFKLAFLLPDPAYARLDVADKPDSSALPAPKGTLYSGHGPDNAKVFKVKPQGDLVRNRYTAKSSTASVLRHNANAELQVGPYQGFESSGQKDAADVLGAFADNQIGAYARPLPMLELGPQDDSGSNRTLRYGVDFVEGDYLKAVGKRGKAYHSLLARVERVVLTNDADSVSTELDVVPAINLPSEVTNG